LNSSSFIYFSFIFYQLPSAIGEEPNFGYSEEILDSFFKPIGVSYMGSRPIIINYRRKLLAHFVSLIIRIPVGKIAEKAVCI